MIEELNIELNTYPIFKGISYTHTDGSTYFDTEPVIFRMTFRCPEFMDSIIRTNDKESDLGSKLVVIKHKVSSLKLQRLYIGPLISNAILDREHSDYFFIKPQSADHIIASFPSATDLLTGCVMWRDKTVLYDNGYIVFNIPRSGRYLIQISESKFLFIEGDDSAPYFDRSSDTDMSIVLNQNLAQYRTNSPSRDVRFDAASCVNNENMCNTPDHYSYIPGGISFNTNRKMCLYNFYENMFFYHYTDPKVFVWPYYPSTGTSEMELPFSFTERVIETSPGELVVYRNIIDIAPGGLGSVPDEYLPVMPTTFESKKWYKFCDSKDNHIDFIITDTRKCLKTSMVVRSYEAYNASIKWTSNRIMFTYRTHDLDIRISLIIGIIDSSGNTELFPILAKPGFARDAGEKEESIFTLMTSTEVIYRPIKTAVHFLYNTEYRCEDFFLREHLDIADDEFAYWIKRCTAEICIYKIYETSDGEFGIFYDGFKLYSKVPPKYDSVLTLGYLHFHHDSNIENAPSHSYVNIINVPVVLDDPERHIFEMTHISSVLLNNSHKLCNSKYSIMNLYIDDNIQLKKGLDPRDDGSIFFSSFSLKYPHHDSDADNSIIDTSSTKICNIYYDVGSNYNILAMSSLFDHQFSFYSKYGNNTKWSSSVKLDSAKYPNNMDIIIYGIVSYLRCRVIFVPRRDLWIKFTRDQKCYTTTRELVSDGIKVYRGEFVVKHDITPISSVVMHSLGNRTHSPDMTIIGVDIMYPYSYNNSSIYIDNLAKVEYGHWNPQGQFAQLGDITITRCNILGNSNIRQISIPIYSVIHSWKFIARKDRDGFLPIVSNIEISGYVTTQNFTNGCVTMHILRLRAVPIHDAYLHQEYLYYLDGGDRLCLAAKLIDSATPVHASSATIESAGNELIISGISKGDILPINIRFHGAHHDTKFIVAKR
jgi:hypothetical protein